MKLSAIFTVFNGLELLEGSIQQIYPYVDEILISYQTISNKGEVNNDLPFLLNKFVNDKIHTIKFNPDLNLRTKENERRKHNQAIQYLKSTGCTHFILSACDHYYTPEEFLKAKIKALSYDVTLTNMFTYFKKPEWQLTPIEDYQMPFICKMYSNTEISNQEYSGFRTDPSVRINTRWKVYCFEQNEIMMHHYSMVRNNVSNKFKNAAASIRWTPDMIKTFQNEFDNYDLQKNEGVSYFKGRKIKVVPNLFDIQVGVANS